MVERNDKQLTSNASWPDQSRTIKVHPCLVVSIRLSLPFDLGVRAARAIWPIPLYLPHRTNRRRADGLSAYAVNSAPKFNAPFVQSPFGPSLNAGPQHPRPRFEGQEGGRRRSDMIEDLPISIPLLFNSVLLGCGGIRRRMVSRASISASTMRDLWRAELRRLEELL